MQTLSHLTQGPSASWSQDEVIVMHDEAIHVSVVMLWRGMFQNLESKMCNYLSRYKQNAHSQWGPWHVRGTGADEIVS